MDETCDPGWKGYIWKEDEFEYEGMQDQVMTKRVEREFYRNEIYLGTKGKSSDLLAQRLVD